MGFKEQFASDLKDAMKSKDVIRKNTIQMVRAAIKQYEVDNRVELDDDGILGILAKEVKQRRDSLPDYERSGRADLVENLNTEIKILMEYLPAQLSEEELTEIIKDAIDKTGASSVKDMGKVMGIVVNSTKGRADAKMIGAIAKRLLS